MENQNEKNKIEKANEALYSKEADAIFSKKRHVLKDNYSIEKIPSRWAEEKEVETAEFQIPYKKIFIGALIFFVAAVGFAAYKFFGGSNMASGGNIDISVTGPVSISGGEVLPLDIQVKNNNNLDLKSVAIRVEFPEGTKNSDNLSKDLTYYTKVLGDIKAGKTSKDLVKAVLYGQENSQKAIKIIAEYRMSGSNATFSKTKEYNVIISSSPVSLSVTGPDEINANQSADFIIKVKSNSLTPVKNLMLKINYPFGFNVSSANPKPFSTDGSAFSLGDLAQGAEMVIRVSGVFQGQSGEERVLTFNVGNPSDSDRNNIKTAFASFSKSVFLNRPSVSLTMAINQNSEKEVPVGVGEKIESTVMWQNNLAENIYNMVVKIKLSGIAINKNSINVTNGYYSSADNTITFDKSYKPEFSSVSPSSEGGLDFDFEILSPSGSATNYNNSKIELAMTVVGTRAANSVPEVLFNDTKTLKVSSNLKLLSRGYKTIGSFENTGPFPPKVDNESTYTITWTATNSWNDTKSAKVEAVLPSNVKWMGYTSPDSEKISYDSASGKVTWSIGDMRANTGSIYNERTASFLVSITPSLSDLGQDMILLNEAVISGIDVFSGAQVGETRSAVTTNITSDPAYTEGIGKVVR